MSSVVEMLQTSSATWRMACGIVWSVAGTKEEGCSREHRRDGIERDQPRHEVGGALSDHWIRVYLLIFCKLHDVV
jgi:hypothetical protein